MSFSAFKSFKLEKGLSLEERKGAAAYKACARINGTVHFHNTETSDYNRAVRVATSWFFKLANAPVLSSDTRLDVPHVCMHRFQTCL